MKYTKKYALLKPEGKDYVLVDDFNKNSDKLDELLNQIDLNMSSKAPLKSPSFTGEPTAPTPDINDNSDKLATTKWVNEVLEVVEIR